ncbi:probable Co/Zn/Cd efflux system membrane fusion protein [Vibrio maritimus]|uniref:Probable Co/Zn/Cd efflux system membrane fusion protein n=1 Tax=Vibrio maritimus TaxID=990268 RepID=A0A090TVP9_9VIBR|nr:probable Co/Zn/Cd efflux system membrane fusion protein [Vibrio maritimus]
MKLHTLTALLIGATLVGCSKPEVGERNEVPKVRVAEIGRTELKSRLYFPALASAADRSHLSFRVAGEISSIDLKEGDFVNRGDVLAVLERLIINSRLIMPRRATTSSIANIVALARW